MRYYNTVVSQPSPAPDQVMNGSISPCQSGRPTSVKLIWRLSAKVCAVLVIAGADQSLSSFFLGWGFDRTGTPRSATSLPYGTIPPSTARLI